MIKLKESAIESSNSKKHFCRNMDSKFVGNKVKGRISKWVSQVNKACQVFCKTNISYSMITTRACTHQRVRNVHFAENLACFFFLDWLFCLITDKLFDDHIANICRKTRRKLCFV